MLRVRSDTESILKWSTEFYFSKTGFHTKAKLPSFSHYLFFFVGGVGVRDRVIPFPNVLAWIEMQTALTRIWTCFAEAISYEDNRCTRVASSGSNDFHKDLMISISISSKNISNFPLKEYSQKQNIFVLFHLSISLFIYLLFFTNTFFYHQYLHIIFLIPLVQSVGSVKYTDCVSADG